MNLGIQVIKSDYDHPGKHNFTIFIDFAAFLKLIENVLTRLQVFFINFSGYMWQYLCKIVTHVHLLDILFNMHRFQIVILDGKNV